MDSVDAFVQSVDAILASKWPVLLVMSIWLWTKHRENDALQKRLDDAADAWTERLSRLSDALRAISERIK